MPLKFSIIPTFLFDLSDWRKFILGEHLKKFLNEIPSKENGAHELMWTEDYGSDLIVFISSFADKSVI